MKKSFENLLATIPEYKRFYTVAEHEENSVRLAKRYPRIVSHFTLGYSQNKQPITCLRIGKGSRTALLYGCPHPNEPIGAMMLDHLSESLARDAELRRDLDYTFYLVKVWDVDSVLLNQDWYNGPFTLHNYTLSYYRPPAKYQVDRTFPIDYKLLHFHSILPETAAIKKLMDEIRPDFIYSLHNSGFGGVFWYISDNFRDIFSTLHWVAKKNGLPLDLGEPDAPYLEVFDQAIFRMAAIRDRYNYLEKYGVEDVADGISAGNNDAAYAREKFGSVSLMTELPYFFDRRIGDRQLTDSIRRDYVMERIVFEQQVNEWLTGTMEGIRDLMSPKNPYYLTLATDGPSENVTALKGLINESPEFAQRGTVAEEFSNRFVAKMERLPRIGYVARACQWEIDQMEAEGIIYTRKADALQVVRQAALAKHEAICVELEKIAEYQVVPISTLISIQLESGLIVMDYLQNTKSDARWLMNTLGSE